MPLMMAISAIGLQKRHQTIPPTIKHCTYSCAYYYAKIILSGNFKGKSNTSSEDLGLKETMQTANYEKTRMWADVQRDGRPAEEILVFNKVFFPIVNTCLSCEDIAGQSCAMVPRLLFLANFCVLYFQQAACSTFQTSSLNLH